MKIACSGRSRPPLAVYHLDVRKVGKIRARTRGKVTVELDTHDMASRTNDVSHDRIVADAATDMNAVALVKVKRIKTERKVARLPIVQRRLGSNGDEDVAVQMHGVVVPRFSGVVDRVVSCWSLVGPAPPSCLVFGPYWTTFGLQPD
jgi:hypothetical protein